MIHSEPKQEGPSASVDMEAMSSNEQAQLDTVPQTSPSCTAYEVRFEGCLGL